MTLEENKADPKILHPIILRSHQNCFYRICFIIVCSALFNILITALIIYNTYILAIYHFEWTLEEEEYRDQTDSLFVAIFSAEILLKFVGLGFHGFKMDSFNNFDFCIVLMSYIEIGFSFWNVDAPLLDALRALRALRMLKLARFNSGMRQIMQ